MDIGLAVPQLGRLGETPPRSRPSPSAPRPPATTHCGPSTDSWPRCTREALPRDARRCVARPSSTPCSIRSACSGLAAAVTERVRIGTNVLVAPWYPPVLLARSLTTLDHISAGRLDIGVGLGWSRDEYEAVGVPKRDLGARLDDALDVLDAIWTNAVVHHDGPYVRIAPSTVEPKPIQHPRPPLLLAAFTPAGLDRIARRADGWLPVGLPHDVLASMWAALRDMTHQHGRDPDALRLVVRANVKITDAHLGDHRPVFSGTIAQIAEDLLATRAVGAHELILDLQADARTATELLELAHDITSAGDHEVPQPERARGRAR